MTSPLTIDTDIEEIVANFSFLDDWEDRYGYLIELGKALKPLPDDAHTEFNKARGCVSQVWLDSRVESLNGSTIVHFTGDSDAHIVRGLVAIALTLFSGKPADLIQSTDENAVFQQIGLEEHLTPQRANGLRAMVERIKSVAREAATEQVAG